MFRIGSDLASISPAHVKKKYVFGDSCSCRCLFARTGNPSLSADISPDGKAYEWPLYDPEKKEVMVFDEFNIHPEKESERKMVDWERMYPLTSYYLL